jgi:hypothetical protein
VLVADTGATQKIARSSAVAGGTARQSTAPAQPGFSSDGTLGGVSTAPPPQRHSVRESPIVGGKESRDQLWRRVADELPELCAQARRAGERAAGFQQAVLGDEVAGDATGFLY